MKILKAKTFGFWEGLFYSTVLWGATVVLTFAAALTDLLIAFPVSFFLDHGTGRILHRVSNIWSRTIIGWSSIWKIVVTGREHLQPGKHYIVIANHQSMLDILAVCAGLPINFKFLAKRELFQIPFMGWAMAAAGGGSLAPGPSKDAIIAALVEQVEALTTATETEKTAAFKEITKDVTEAATK